MEAHNPSLSFCKGASRLSLLTIIFVQVSVYDRFGTQTHQLWIQLMTVGTIIRNMYAKTPR